MAHIGYFWVSVKVKGAVWVHLVSSKRCHASSLCWLNLCNCGHRGSHGAGTMVSVLVQFWGEDPAPGACFVHQDLHLAPRAEGHQGRLGFFLGLKPCCLWVLSHHTLFQGPEGSVSRFRETQKETTYIRKTEVGTAWYVGFQLLCLGKDKHTIIHTYYGRVGEGNGNSLQHSCLENPMDRGAWQATVHGVTKSWTRLSN